MFSGIDFAALEESYGRMIDPEDGSVYPSKDTGFRATPAEPFVYNQPERRATTVPVLTVHNDDLTDVGRALNAVRFYKIDYAKVEQRVLALITENIAERAKRGRKEEYDASRN